VNSGLLTCKTGTLPLEPRLPVHFTLVILEMGFYKLFVPTGFKSLILPISASQVARITGMSHQRLAWSSHFGSEFGSFLGN
jgi:hypothetical protein